MERTLIVLKPDTIQRGLVGEIMTRFERVGLKIIASKMLRPDNDHYYHHYENIGQMISRRGQQAFDVTLEMMNQGPVIAFVLEGVGAVEVVRKMVGTTEPKSALPGTIRGDYAHVSFSHADTKKKVFQTSSMHQETPRKPSRKSVTGSARVSFSTMSQFTKRILRSNRI